MLNDHPTEILDKVVDFLESDKATPASPSGQPLTTDLTEWNTLRTELRESLGGQKLYGCQWWHRGYVIDLHGSKLLYCKATEEEYVADLKRMFNHP